MAFRIKRLSNQSRLGRSGYRALQSPEIDTDAGSAFPQDTPGELVCRHCHQSESAGAMFTTLGSSGYCDDCTQYA